ncbi:hypothetical protein F2Q68_00020234 [Brassica cretica]|uniref:Uncharacterized protein n=1 Tax=Brassica cretica TaxID=69181 RepID=A0A8S9G2H0_BRACR|nr:hypothetical protein F2Q68_00020234 [Brassica cretica]
MSIDTVHPTSIDNVHPASITIVHYDTVHQDTIHLKTVHPNTCHPDTVHPVKNNTTCGEKEKIEVLILKRQRRSRSLPRSSLWEPKFTPSSFVNRRKAKLT